MPPRRRCARRRGPVCPGARTGRRAGLAGGPAGDSGAGREACRRARGSWRRPGRRELLAERPGDRPLARRTGGTRRPAACPGPAGTRSFRGGQRPRPRRRPARLPRRRPPARRHISPDCNGGQAAALQAMTVIQIRTRAGTSRWSSPPPPRSLASTPARGRHVLVPFNQIAKHRRVHDAHVADLGWRIGVAQIAPRSQPGHARNHHRRPGDRRDNPTARYRDAAPAEPLRRSQRPPAKPGPTYLDREAPPSCRGPSGSHRLPPDHTE